MDRPSGDRWRGDRWAGKKTDLLPLAAYRLWRRGDRWTDLLVTDGGVTDGQATEGQATEGQATENTMRQTIWLYLVSATSRQSHYETHSTL